MSPNDLTVNIMRLLNEQPTDKIPVTEIIKT